MKLTNSLRRLAMICSLFCWVQVTGIGEADRCGLDQTPEQDNSCGPRCAYLINDPGRCEGHETVNVPVYGLDMDPENLPCAGPGTPDTGAGGGSGETTDAGGSGDGGAADDGSNSGGNAGTSQACIDVKALHHLPSEDLVFEKHALAHVLCDANDSCATPGHMVVFCGKAMMMRRYCDIAECSEQVMHVNSPRFKRGIRVPSSTDGLEFTAFASRYETRAEEAFISAVVRTGL